LWSDQKFTFTLPAGLTLADSELYVEVWDKNTVGGAGSNTFLGSALIKDEALEKLVRKSRFMPTWFPLSLSDYLPGKIQDMAQGEVELRIGISGEADKPLPDAQKFEIDIMSATGLARADGMFGLSDPFVIAKWNYQEIGRTEHVSKTLSPVWSDEVFAFYVNPDVDAATLGTNVLHLEVWDYDLIGKGNFLGVATITGPVLVELFTHIDEERCLFFDLEAHPKMDPSLQKFVQGKVELCLHRPDDSKSSLAKAMNLKWDSERDPLAGPPFLSVQIMSGSDLPVTNRVTGKCNALCVVKWGEDEAGSTPAVNSTNPIWKQEEASFSLPVPQYAEADDIKLVISVYDQDMLLGRRGEFLGCIFLSFRSLLRLYQGVFTLPLSHWAAPEAVGGGGGGGGVGGIPYVRGSLTLRLGFKYSFWDSITPHNKHAANSSSSAQDLLLRSVCILGANGLSGVNDESPTTKVTFSVDGVTKLKSIVIAKNSNPCFPQTQVDLLVDLHVEMDLLFTVLHIDVKDRREVPIGQCIMPFEILTRPPKEPFTLTLTPPARAPPKKYRFTAAGTLSLFIIADQSLVKAQAPLASSLGIPECSLVVHDVCPASVSKSKQDALYDGDMLSDKQKAWIGTCTTLTHTHTLDTHKEWVLVPIHDPGMRVGWKAVDMLGTRPGHRMALCIEREKSRANVSDFLLLDDVADSVEACINTLRKKEIYRTIRAEALARFTKFLMQAVAMQDAIEDSQVHAWLVDAITTCFPGTTIYAATVSQDYRSLKYSVFEGQGSKWSFVLSEKQGYEWLFAGRHPPRSGFFGHALDLRHKHIITHRPFVNTSFPRFVVPLTSGDVSLGFFGVEAFDVHKGNLHEPMSDEAEVKKWLEELGSVCGETIYAGREKRALADIESYVMGWGSSTNGVVKEIMRCCMNVVQGM